MRRKMGQSEKRRIMIGVKVDEATKRKIEKIAEREAEPTSTYIYNLLKKHIDEYEKIAKLNLDEI